MIAKSLSGPKRPLRYHNTTTLNYGSQTNFHAVDIDAGAGMSYTPSLAARHQMFAMKTYSAKPSEIEKKWVLIDAEGLIVGRLAAIIAKRLRGKHKPLFTPHLDCGDNVIVINAEKVAFTGRKREARSITATPGIPAASRSVRAHQVLDGKFPERVVEDAVRRMIPGGPLKRALMRNLRVYKGAAHPHEAQAPEKLDIAAMNPKNKLRD